MYYRGYESLELWAYVHFPYIIMTFSLIIVPLNSAIFTRLQNFVKEVMGLFIQDCQLF